MAQEQLFTQYFRDIVRAIENLIQRFASTPFCVITEADLRTELAAELLKVPQFRDPVYRYYDGTQMRLLHTEYYYESTRGKYGKYDVAILDGEALKDSRNTSQCRILIGIELALKYRRSTKGKRGVLNKIKIDGTAFKGVKSAPYGLIWYVNQEPNEENVDIEKLKKKVKRYASKRKYLENVTIYYTELYTPPLQDRLKTQLWPIGK